MRHPRVQAFDLKNAHVDNRKYEHRELAELALGKLLNLRHPVHHHYNDDGSVTLIVCESKTYHSLLHIRTKAIKECGHANWRKCAYCKKHDNIKKLFINSQDIAYHKDCVNEYQRNRRANCRNSQK